MDDAIIKAVDEMFSEIEKENVKGNKWNNHTGKKILRGIDGSRLVIACDTMNYRLRMLETNKIPGLLPLKVRESDGARDLCYDISSRVTFGSIGSVRTLKMKDVRDIVYSIRHILENIEKYLLVPDELVMDKDYIYVCSDDLDPRLCYLPGYDADFAAGLSNLLREVMGMVDHNDHEAVVLAYSLYQESMKPGYSIGDLLRVVNNEDSGGRDAEKKVPYGIIRKEKTADGMPAGYGISASGKLPDLAQQPAPGRRSGQGMQTEQYTAPMQDPGTAGQRKTGQERSAVFTAVSRIGKFRHGTIFSR